MLIAARNGFAVKRWKNPYVTDGLVAFYDGTWNAGKGKHDATLTAPVNLVTGEMATAYDGGVSFNQNSMTLSKDNIGSARQNIAIGSGDITIDFLVKSTGRDSNCFLGFALMGSSGPFLKCQKNSSVSIGWGMGNVFYPVNLTGGLNEIQAKTCVVHQGNKLSLFTNGSFSQDYSYTGGFGGMPFIIGNTKTNVATYQPDGNIYRILVYSRALTASEIAANYAVDKARFGLP